MSIFIVISITLDSIITPSFSSGVWYGWIFVISPITGILLGPRDGFIATLISVILGHTLIFRESVYEYIFTLGAPICSMISAYTLRGELKKVFLYYIALLLFYFISPASRGLPIWGMWDCYLAFITIIVVGILKKTNKLNLVDSPRLHFALCTFLGLEADILFRIFVFVPLRAYDLFYGITREALALIWAIPAPLITPIKVAFSTIFSSLLVPRLLKAITESK
jgi:hypothetical protein